MFFRNTQNGAMPGQAYQSPPEVYGHPVHYKTEITQSQSHLGGGAQSSTQVQELIDDHLAVYSLIRAYQVTMLCLHKSILLLNILYDNMIKVSIHIKNNQDFSGKAIWIKYCMMYAK